MNRQLIEQGKIYQVYPDDDKENILYEGTRAKCLDFIKAFGFQYRYKKGLIRIAKLIYEKH